MTAEDILDKLPFELAARLQTDPFFEDIPIIVVEEGNIASEFERSQAVITEKSGKRGVAVFVLQIIGNDVWEGIPGAPMKLKPAFQVIENVDLNHDDNGTKKSVRKVARRIVRVMKIAGFHGFVQAMKCANPCIIPVDMKEFGEGTVSEQVNFECLEFNDEQTQFCLPPFCSQVPGQTQIQLTTATDGAQIWYTLDDKFPYPGGKDVFPISTAQLYTGPIAVQLNMPVTIRACAYLNKFTGNATNYVPSSVVRFSVTVTTTT